MSPLRFLGWVLAALFGLMLVAMLAFNLYGREESWAALFGPADLGPYDFNQPTRSGKLNDTLACPPGACAKGVPDLETPRYAIPAANLFAIAHGIVAKLPGKSHIIGANPVGMRLRAVIYSPVMRVPSTLSVMVEPTPDGGSELFVYSRSQVGYYDMGRNTANIVDLMDGIAKAIAATGAPTPPAAKATEPPKP